MSYETLYNYQKEILDSKSKSFCGAKWLSGTIWLDRGNTASCCLSTNEHIPIEEVKENNTILHNTKSKKEIRKLMQDGIKHKDCQYCWNIENDGGISERVHRSKVFSNKELNDVFISDYKSDIIPLRLEISFDNVCNMACSYCNSNYSTTWYKDISGNGCYENMYVSNCNMIPSFKKTNVYIDAFLEWYDEILKNKLQSLRITGGEPLLNKHTWKILSIFRKEKIKSKLVINSNLMHSKETIDKFINEIKNIKDFRLFTSCESYGKQAEYIRDGLIYKEWINNLKRINKETNTEIFITLTINNLCLFNLTKFLEDIHKLKKDKTSKQITVCFSILSNPAYQHISVLPKVTKENIYSEIKSWYNEKDRKYFNKYEQSGMDMFLGQLKKSIDVEPNIETTIDFKSFFSQYDKRRNKDIYVFPKMLTDWYDNIKDLNE